MKLTLLKLGVLIIAISICMPSCQKDKIETKNMFKYNQKESKIGQVLELQWGETNLTGLFSIQMEFYEETFTNHYSYNHIDSLSGSGDFLVVTLLSTKEDQIVPGVYNYPSTNDDNQAFTIYSDGVSGLQINYNRISGSFTPFINISGGKVTVSKQGDENEFIFDLKTNINTSISGNYKGKTIVFNGSKKKSVFVY